MYKFLDLVRQNDLVRKDINQAISKLLDSASFIGGDEISEFENNFSNFVGVNSCVGVGNGTDALEICIEALELPPGSEIIVPVNSFIATSEAVLRSGHKVIFSDVLEKNATIDPISIEEKISRNTVAVIAVHLYGHPCAVQEILELCEKYGLVLIEDCAQSHGARVNGKMVGSFGTVSAFSFYPGKNLGGIGDGGAILTNDKKLAQRSRMISQHGRKKKQKYVHDIIGRNSRLDTMNAAVLNIKLKKLPEWLKHRNALAKKYISCLEGSKTSTFEVDENVFHSYHLFVCRSEDRDGLKSFLSKKGVETGIHYPVPLHKQPAHANENDQAHFPIASKLANDSISLPMGEHLTTEDVENISNIIKAY